MARLAIIEYKQQTATQKRKGEQKELIEIELSELTDIGRQQMAFECDQMKDKLAEIDAEEEE